MQFGTQAGVATRHGTSITAKVFADARAHGCKLVNFEMCIRDSVRDGA